MPGFGVEFLRNFSMISPSLLLTLSATFFMESGLLAGEAEKPIAPPASLEDVYLWSVNEPVNSEENFALSTEFPCQVWVRAIFKWRNARPVDTYAKYVRAAAERGIIYGGGITMSAIYRGENGISEEEFMDLATRDVNSQLYPGTSYDSSYQHGTLSNPRYLDYCLKWVYQQMDVGITHFHMDEITGVHRAMEGYDDYALKDFREWLLANVGLTANDPKWTEQYAVSLEPQAGVCPDGTLNTFNYREYLKSRGCADEKLLADLKLNRLSGLWARFKIERNDRAWRYVCDQMREYAKKKGQPVFITSNGLAKYVDHQTVYMGTAQLCLDGNKRVDASRSLFATAENWLLASRAMLDADVPVFAFHDWGNGMPWVKDIDHDEDRRLWLRVYAPEFYAAGVYLGFPVLCAHGGHAVKNGAFDTIKLLTEFVAQHHENYVFRGRNYVGRAPLKVLTPRVTASLIEYPAAGRQVVHLINHNFSTGQMQAQKGIEVTWAQAQAPLKAVACSPDFAGEQEVPFTYADGMLHLTVPALEYYNLVVLTYPGEFAPLVIKSNALSLTPFDAQWGKLGWSGPYQLPEPDLSGLSRYVHGSVHREMQVDYQFAVDYPRAGAFSVDIDSVAAFGAVLELDVDGALAARMPILDRDGKNASGGLEIDSLYTVSVPAGKHLITIRNTGADWFTVSRYIFHNAKP